jgi:hypothetical protein
MSSLVRTNVYDISFRYAIARGLASRNPAAEFKPSDIRAEARTENFARVDTKDLPELLVKMDDYNGDALTRFGLELSSREFRDVSESTELVAPRDSLVLRAKKIQRFTTPIPLSIPQLKIGIHVTVCRVLLCTCRDHFEQEDRHPS